MIWRPHTEAPAARLSSALIARRDDSGEWFLLGIYSWKGGAWRHEDTDRPMRDPEAEFFWMDELELLAALPQTKEIHA